MWLQRDLPEPPALKAWFREMDKDRNGMIDEQELGLLLRKGGSKKIQESEVHAIWQELDKNGDGHILFDEFVDFIFSPPDKNVQRLMRPEPKRKGQRLDTQAIDFMKVAAETTEMLIPMVEIFGATHAPQLNGGYKAVGTGWVVDKQGHSEPGEDGVVLNGKAVFTRNDSKYFLFFGFLRGGKRQGWFVSESKSEEAEPVVDWIAFNPSPLANLPDLCYSAWEIQGAVVVRDKRMCCEATYIMKNKGRREAVKTDRGSAASMEGNNLRGGWDRIHNGMSNCLKDELWDVLDSDEEDAEDENPAAEEAPDDEELWEQSWADQQGEDCSESSGEHSDEYVAALQARLEKKGRKYNHSGSAMWRDYVQAANDRVLSGVLSHQDDEFGTGDHPAGIQRAIDGRRLSNMKPKKNPKKLKPGGSQIWRDYCRAKDGLEVRGTESAESDASDEDNSPPASRRTSHSSIESHDLVHGGATRDSMIHDGESSIRSRSLRGGATRDSLLSHDSDLEGSREGRRPSVASKISKASKASTKRPVRKRKIPKIFADGEEELKFDEQPKIAQPKDGEDHSDDPLIHFELDGYLDRDFPPIEASLGKTSADSTGWTRLPSLHQRSRLFAKVVPDDVMADDSAGNLWFLSACAAVAEYPAWIKTIFGRRTQLTRKHRYKVRLYHPGKKHFVRIIVDDYVPTLNGKAPSFAGLSVGGEAWVALLEKAFAKLCGSYANTEWGDTAYGLLYLCGGGGAEKWERVNKGGLSTWKKSTTSWNGRSEDRIERESAEGFVMDGSKRDEDAIWKMLRKYTKFCYPMTCGVQSGTKELCGLEDDRCYSLIRTCEIPAGPGTSLRMLLLRNPWGVGEWEGRWSDSSTTWEENPYAAEHVNLRAEQDGTFWMAYNDFLDYFSVIYTVKKSMPIQGCNRQKHQELKRGLMHYQDD